ncbi:hypothetical protein Patl1_15056 [Pistacia atlantica]|uniref:Uncharacterized protein n=1 Tax=Pistacia atlantica TaxID=434234 RepID=A0ACC1B6N6_9ROSI|nr:hypothetical protein Patl1_15056 [Pistacia atlantica]
MTKNFMFTFIFHLFPSPSVCTSILFLLSRTVLAAVDPHYVACEPKTCGDGRNISFPFYIQGQQKPFCGYPGFNLSCNNKGNPVLNLHNIDYIILQIFYSNHSLRVSNAAVSETINVNSFCINPPHPRNQTLSLPDDRFALVSNQTELLLLYDCSSSLPGKLLQYKAGKCEDNNKTRTVLALFKGDPNLGNASKECGQRSSGYAGGYARRRQRWSWN